MAVDIKELAKEQNIKFELLLSGIAREETLCSIAESVFGPYLWLCSPESIGIETYRVASDRVLTFAYKREDGEVKDGMPGSRLNDRVKGAILLLLTGKTYENGNKVTGKVGHDGGIYIDVYVQGMRVPFRIDVFPVLNGIYSPLKREATLIRSGKSFIYNRYPSESEVAKGLFKIFKNLELMTDMSVYHRVFCDIMNSPLEGKLVWSELCEYVKSDAQRYDISFYDRLLSYKESPNMKESWVKYIKRQNIESLEWKKVINAISVFVKPIWEAVCEDSPFIGDWMPELGRFL